ncbi:protoporphyrinogen/coproporphyrinogen oxidase [Aestuariimicrobium ganziense]|uniref:protoporphyrinogen/coproporphyrinogen oxidase n=1 Tax=Aestuariimicrobium ganziense TaxID=2773677 RepID=UPI001A9BF357|nr:FAD-dependent oxidoreductase [Aestuariimicrobium ganziense]
MNAVVVGGGLAGLVAAHRLVKAGMQVTLLEASGVLGGMVGRVTLGGVTVDSGAEAYAVRGGVGRSLCEELGLTVHGPAGQPHLWWPDGVWPMAEGVLGIPASLDDPALGVLTPAELERLRLDAELDRAVGSDSTTVGDLVRLRLGDGALAKLVTPVARGVYSLEPDRMPLASFAPGLLQALGDTGSLVAAVAAVRRPGAAAVEQPEGGMFRLVDALADAIRAGGGSIVTTAPVTALRRGTSGFVVQTGESSLAAEKLVLAAPASLTAGLMEPLGVQFAVPGVKTARLTMLSIRSEALADAPIGSGLLVGRPDPEIKAKALTHYSEKWPWARVNGQEVIRLSYPEQLIPSLVDAIADASRFLGTEIADRDVTGIETVGWEAMPTRLEPSTAQHLRGLFSEAGVDVVGGWLDGNGIASVIAGGAGVAS